MSTHIGKIEHIENAHFHNNNTPSLPSNIPDDIKPDFKLLYDSLKERYKKRFDSKLDGRFEITLEVNKDWNVNQPQTFKVNYREDTNIDEAFKSINEAFERQGRLLIVGSPGSGKTVLLLKFALDLLGNECKSDQKFPVIFNLASLTLHSSNNFSLFIKNSSDWFYENFENWLIDILIAGNSLSKDFARKLLQENRIILLLDGLDELARNEETKFAHQKRAECLRSLNEYLREGRKAVICCRREEFIEMQKKTNQEAPVSATIEVIDLSKAEIHLALQHAQNHNESRASANNLLQIIETNDVFLDVLSTPFYFTTALEVFDKQLLNKKDFSTDEKEVKKYLLDRFIEKKLKHTRKLKDFENDKAKVLNWISWLAKLMEKKQLIIFELADLQPNDLTRTWLFSLVSGLFFGWGLGLFISICVFFYDADFSQFVYTSLFFGLVNSLGFFFLMHFGIVRLYGDKTITVEDSINIDFPNIDFPKRYFHPKLLLEEIINRSFFGLVAGFLLGLIVVLPIIRFLSWKVVIIFVSFCVLFGIFSYSFEILKATRSLIIIKSPYQRIKGGFRVKAIVTISEFVVSMFLLILLLTFVFLLNLIFGFISIESYFEFIDIKLLLLLISLLLLINIITEWAKLAILRHLYLRLCLWFEGSTPLEYATFLDLAAEARILEKDGGHWRFRHQTLQEHFAKMNT